MLVVLVAACALAVAADSCDRQARRAQRTLGVPTAAQVDPGAESGAPVIQADLSGDGALHAIQEQGLRQTRRLQRELERNLDGQERLRLEEALREARRESRAQTLWMMSRVARDRGDEAAARDAERQLRMLRDPPRPAYPEAPGQVPSGN